MASHLVLAWRRGHEEHDPIPEERMCSPNTSTRSPEKNSVGRALSTVSGRPMMRILFLLLRPSRSMTFSFSLALSLAKAEQLDSRALMSSLTVLVLDSRDDSLLS